MRRLLLACALALPSLAVQGPAVQAFAATAEFAARRGSMTVTFTDDGREIARAQGTALLGQPLAVIPWRDADLARSGRALKAGDIVSPGGFAPSVRAVVGHSYEGMLAALVSVAVGFR